MIDALLFALRDAIRNAGFGYDAATCEIMDPTGHPPPRMGDWFVAVAQQGSSNAMMNALDEYFDFNLVLTARLTNVPLDRVGDQLLAKQLARKAGPGGSPSFNARAEQLRAFCHMDWGILQDANTNLIAMTPGNNLVYGFVEPAHYAGMEDPQLVGGEWFGAEPESTDVGLKAEIRFEGCRRLQAIATYV